MTSQIRYADADKILQYHSCISDNPVEQLNLKRLDGF